MSQTGKQGVPKKRLILCIVLAVVFAAAAPYFTVMSMSVIAYPVLAAFMFAYAGFVPALILSLLTLTAYYVYFGTPAMLMALAAVTLPSAVMLRGLKWRRPFFRQMSTNIVTQVFGVVLALFIAYIFVGSDLAGAFSGWLRGVLDSVSPGLTDTLLAQLYQISSAPKELAAEDILTGFLSQAQRESYLGALMSDVSTFMSLMLPGYLISSSIMTGLIATLWGNCILRNEVSPEGERYVPLSNWYISWRYTLGSFASLGIAYLVYALGISGGDTIYMTVRTLLFTLLRVQAAISVERRLKGSGAKTWVRIVIIIVSQLLLGEIVIYYGSLSVLFGTTGVASQIRRMKDDKKDN